MQDHDICVAIETNIAELFEKYAGGDGGCFEVRHGVRLASCNIDHPQLNRAMAADVPKQEIARATEAAADFFNQLGRRWGWTIGPASRPQSLATELLNHGFQQQSATPGMAMRLQDFEAVGDADVVQVRTDQHLEDTVHVLLTTFNLPEAFGDLVRADFRAPKPALRSYILYEDDRPISVAATFRGSRAVGVYNVGTVPEAQGKGYGRRVMNACLRDAARDGAEIAILQSTKAGLPLYERLGFRTYCVLYGFSPPAVATPPCG